MVLIGDDGAGGAAGGEEADATFLGSEPTLHIFSGEKVENAQRNAYRADASGVHFYLTIGMEALNNPDVVNTVAREWAATWNANARVPGVREISESEQTTTLGNLRDVAEVEVASTSGKSTTIVTVQSRDYEHQLFVNQVEYWRHVLDVNEATG